MTRMSDMDNDVDAIERAVGTGTIPAGEGRTVMLRRTYDADIEDVWDAITSAERLPRWFLPVTGDLRVGGRYQLHGNAGGEILQCEPPKLVRLTWGFGENLAEKDFSEVEVRLAPGGDGRTHFTLEHTAVPPPEM